MGKSIRTRIQSHPQTQTTLRFSRENAVRRVITMLYPCHQISKNKIEFKRILKLKESSKRTQNTNENKESRASNN